MTLFGYPQVDGYGETQLPQPILNLGAAIPIPAQVHLQAYKSCRRYIEPPIV